MAVFVPVWSSSYDDFFEIRLFEDQNAQQINIVHAFLVVPYLFLVTKHKLLYVTSQAKCKQETD